MAQVRLLEMHGAVLPSSYDHEGAAVVTSALRQATSSTLSVLDAKFLRAVHTLRSTPLLFANRSGVPLMTAIFHSRFYAPLQDQRIILAGGERHP